MLWPIDRCQNRISVDQCHMNDRGFRCQVIEVTCFPLTSCYLLIDRKTQVYVFQSYGFSVKLSIDLLSFHYFKSIVCSEFKMEKRELRF